MKIILSRKGIDGGTGKRPSPLIETQDGWVPVSIPIPGGNETRTYGEVTVNGHNLGKLVSDLGVLDKNGNPSGRRTPVHFDPDLDRDSINGRPPGWRPLFGQCNAALSHLKKQNVEQEDVFLFFGRFRKAKFFAGRLDFISTEPEIHALFGWLQIGEMFCEGKSPAWAEGHPHVDGDKETARYGTVFTSNGDLTMKGIPDPGTMAGAGAFRKFTQSAQLTWEGERRSIWKLPTFFLPDPSRPALSYHQKNPDRWAIRNGSVQLEIVARGQEFVLDLDPKEESGLKPFPPRDRKTILKWVFELIKTHA